VKPYAEAGQPQTGPAPSRRSMCTAAVPRLAQP